MLYYAIYVHLCVQEEMKQEVRHSQVNNLVKHHLANYLWR